MKTLLISLLIAGSLFADEIVESLDVDGQHYESVKWGAVNQGKVVIFHSHGVAIIPLEKLPAEYQAKFGYKPDPAAPAPPQVEPPEPPRIRTKHNSQATGDWAAYNHDRLARVVLDGKLVEKSSLTTLTGFLVRERAQLNAENQTLHGAVLEIAARRDDAGDVASSMELRPSLWRRTGEQVLLMNYKPEAIVGGLMRVYVVEAKAVDDYRVFKVGTEPSFEQWQTLTRR